MDQGGSKTATLVAGYRGRASARPSPICSDPWAAALSGDEGLALTRRFDAAFEHAELWIALRTAAIDDQIRRFTAMEASAHAHQVVILGAGLDTRAARLAQEGVRFFEVDHRETQADKFARIQALDRYPAEAATYVACDFESEDFLERLVASGFDAGAPAVVVWEGVTYYLSEAAVRSTLARLASGCSAETVVIFDYVRKKLVAGQVKDPLDLATRDVVADLGEPLRFGIDDAVPLLAAEGFRYVRSASFDELCLAYTGTYDRSRKFRFQHIAAASRARAVTL